MESPNGPLLNGHLTRAHTTALFRHESLAGLRFHQQNFDVPNQKQQICRHQRAVKTRFTL